MNFYERLELLQKVQKEQEEILKKMQEIGMEHTKRTDESIAQVIDLINGLSLRFYSSSRGGS